MSISMELRPACTIPILLVLLLVPGCIDLMEEDLSPELTLSIEDQYEEIDDDELGPAMKDHFWLCIKLNITNQNDRVDHNLKYNRMFMGCSDGVKYWCREASPEDPLIEHGTSELVAFYFEIPEGINPEWIEYQNTMGEKYRVEF
jgi:hypothetical protein